MSTKGAKPIKEEDIDKIIERLGKNIMGSRDVAMFSLQVGTGFRISELLSLQVRDLINLTTQKLSDEVSVKRGNMKGKREGRTVPLPDVCVPYLKKYISEWEDLFHIKMSLEMPLFPSRKKDKEGLLQSMTQRQADRIYSNAASSAGLPYKVSTHSCRKTLAGRVMEATKDITAVQQALGHRNIASTMCYLPKNTESVKLLMKNFGKKDKLNNASKTSGSKKSTERVESAE